MRQRISYLLLWSGILLFFLRNMQSVDTYIEIIIAFIKEQWSIFIIIFAIILSKEKSPKKYKNKKA